MSPVMNLKNKKHTQTPANVGVITTAVALGGMALTPAQAQLWDLGAKIQTEVRYFPSEAQYPDQFDHVQPSIAIEPEVRWKSSSGKHEVVVRPFYRADAQDTDRSHADLREGYYRFTSDANWSLTVGVQKVFWGVAESRHLVDIINQVDSVEDIDEEDRLGQPMVQLAVQTGIGRFEGFVMSGFRDRTFPGNDGRLRGPLSVDTDNPIFERDSKRAAIDLAGRFSTYIGGLDFGLSIFHGTSREPRFAVGPLNDRLLPVYDKITQGGLDLQYTVGPLLVKGEAIVREGHGDNFFAGVAGFEYTLYQIAGTPWDLGLLGEYLYDDRDEGFVQEDYGLTNVAPQTIFDKAIFGGMRLGLNDTQDTALLVGMTTDVDDGSKGIFVEAERRFGNNWTVELEGRFFKNIDPNNALAPINKDDFVTFRLNRYF